MSLSADEIQLEKQWQKMFPSVISGLFAFYESLCSIGVVGCELGSVLIDQYNSTIYVGFWSGLFLISAWISQALAGTFFSVRSRRFFHTCFSVSLSDAAMCNKYVDIEMYFIVFCCMYN